MNEADLIIQRIARALKSKLGKEGDRCQLIHNSGTDEAHTGLFLDREVRLLTYQGDDL